MGASGADESEGGTLVDRLKVVGGAVDGGGCGVRAENPSQMKRAAGFVARQRMGVLRTGAWRACAMARGMLESTAARWAGDRES
eukprot:scaffold167822_cov17-Tisochrysis_lutea.AAC.1